MKKKYYFLFLVLIATLCISSEVMACGCGCKGDNCGDTQQISSQDTTEEKVQCPVMKSWFLPSKAADSVEYSGKTYYFCCDGCKEQFLKNPSQYLELDTKS